MIRQLLATKSFGTMQQEANARQGFKRTLTAVDLTLLGVGVAVGSGIFVLTGHAAANNAGPAVSLAFVLAALGAALGSLCYAEMASMMPVAGSAYSYAYATLGELVAFLIGWDLMLEYMVGAATVGAGWSGYAVALVEHLTGYALPAALCQAPWSYNSHTHNMQATGAYFNAPAVFIIMLLTTILVRGVRGSSRVNAALVAVKTIAVLLFVGVCGRYVNPANWHPFVPPNEGQFGHYGWSGVLQGATLVFFSYLGIDNLTTAALETKDPQRSLPRAICWTLLLCSTLYVAVSLVLTGVVPFRELHGVRPIAAATAAVGLPWLGLVVEVGATAGLTSVILVQLYGQPRIFFAMAQDGLLPRVGAAVHKRYGTPYVTTILTGSLCALAAALLPMDFLAELCSIGTLFAFMLVSAGVIVLRIQQPSTPRRFRVPLGYTIPLCSIAVCLLLMRSVGERTLLRLLVWLVLGLCLYFGYSRRHSRLAQAAA